LKMYLLPNGKQKGWHGSRNWGAGLKGGRARGDVAGENRGERSERDFSNNLHDFEGGVLAAANLPPMNQFNPQLVSQPCPGLLSYGVQVVPTFENKNDVSKKRP